MPVPEMPIPVADDEVIVRCVFFPHHFDKNGKIKPAAFHPPAESEDISTIRHDYVGTDFCKQKAKEMRTAAREYRGLGALTARDIRSAKCEIEDSRQVFFGHADIKIGFVVPRGDPPQGQNEELLAKKRALANALRYYSDPTPAEQTWTGEAIPHGITIDRQ